MRSGRQVDRAKQQVGGKQRHTGAIDRCPPTWIEGIDDQQNRGLGVVRFDAQSIGISRVQETHAIGSCRGGSQRRGRRSVSVGFDERHFVGSGQVRAFLYQLRQLLPRIGRPCDGQRTINQSDAGQGPEVFIQQSSWCLG